MKIDSEQLLATVNKFKNDPPEKNETSTAAAEKTSSLGKDRVELSIRRAEIERLKKTMQDIPDVRDDKVARLKEQIAAGVYQVDGKEVAKKMLQSWRTLNGK